MVRNFAKVYLVLPDAIRKVLAFRWHWWLNTCVV